MYSAHIYPSTIKFHYVYLSVYLFVKLIFSLISCKWFGEDFFGKKSFMSNNQKLKSIMYSSSCCCSRICLLVNISIIVFLIGLCKVPKEVSQLAGFKGAHKFGVGTPLLVKIEIKKIFNSFLEISSFRHQYINNHWFDLTFQGA